MFAEALDGFFQDFGTAGTLGGVAVLGIFDAAYVDPLGVESSGPIYTLPSADAASAFHGTTLAIGATTYKVRGIEPDGTGITVLRLEKQ